MSILLQKDDLNLKNESQKIVEIKDYEEKLKFELIEYFSKEISFLIKDGSYQDAIDFVQNRLNTRFEIPLKQKEKDITGNLNELILNEKTKFKNFFIYLKNVTFSNPTIEFSINISLFVIFSTSFFSFSFYFCI